ncbi:MAG TPA: VTT domain-containing protein [Longimicrobiales bacterium]|nr:VTT domain-containing protein [Longimicrobiales bacterium]
MESEIFNFIAGYLVRFGPVVLFFACMLETAIFAGLVLPVGALIAFSAMLSSRGVFEPWSVAVAAAAGALVGDQLGFAVGRFLIRAAGPARGVARVWSAALKYTEALIIGRRHAGIVIGRVIPFVRTVLPWFAGRSGVTWPRFFVFDLAGVVIWAVIYVGGGFAAGEGWRQVADQYGEIAGGILAIAALIVFVVLNRRVAQRLTRSRRPMAEADTPVGPRER